MTSDSIVGLYLRHLSLFDQGPPALAVSWIVIVLLYAFSKSTSLSLGTKWSRYNYARAASCLCKGVVSLPAVLFIAMFLVNLLHRVPQYIRTSVERHVSHHIVNAFWQAGDKYQDNRAVREVREIRRLGPMTQCRV